MDFSLRSHAARRRELCEFLKYARSRIAPSDLGIPATGRRRVPGLRRDEVAALCGVSVAWYTWFETGRPNVHASPRFIAAIASSLQLDERETTYLFSLAIAEMPKMPAPTLNVADSTGACALLTRWPNVGMAALYEAWEAFPVGVYCTTPDGSILYANDALIDLMGYSSRASYMQLDVSNLYADPDERSKWQREIERRGSLRNVVMKARRADGHRIEVRDTAAAVRADDGSISCYVGTWDRTG